MLIMVGHTNLNFSASIGGCNTVKKHGFYKFDTIITK